MQFRADVDDNYNVGFSAGVPTDRINDHDQRIGHPCFSVYVALSLHTSTFDIT